jgi:ADP-heptose:LPS heptosyltransferase
VALPWQEISNVVGEFNKAGIDALDRLWETIPELNEEYDMAINFTHNWSSSYLSEKVKARER